MLHKVSYLELGDVLPNNVLQQYVHQNKPSAMFVHANWCGYCNQMKPEYQKLANMNIPYRVLAVQADGDEKTEKPIMNVIKKWDPEFRGFPWIGLFNSQGQFVGVHKGARTADDILNSMKMKGL